MSHSPTSSSSSSSASTQKTKRTRDGCFTCKKRRIKCDQHKPSCLNCGKSNRVCEGYRQKFEFRDGLNYVPAQTLPPQQYPQTQHRNLKFVSCSNVQSVEVELPQQPRYAPPTTNIHTQLPPIHTLPYVHHGPGTVLPSLNQQFAQQNNNNQPLPSIHQHYNYYTSPR